MLNWEKQPWKSVSSKWCSATRQHCSTQANLLRRAAALPSPFALLLPCILKYFITLHGPVLCFMWKGSARLWGCWENREVPTRTVMINSPSEFQEHSTLAGGGESMHIMPASHRCMKQLAQRDVCKDCPYSWGCASPTRHCRGQATWVHPCSKQKMFPETPGFSSVWSFSDFQVCFSAICFYFLMESMRLNETMVPCGTWIAQLMLATNYLGFSSWFRTITIIKFVWMLNHRK